MKFHQRVLLMQKKKNVCPLSLKLKKQYVSIETIYNEWFGIGKYTRIIPGGIYSLETLHPEWHKNNNSALNKKLPRLQFIETTVAALAYYTCNPDDLVLYALKEIIPKTKRYLFGIN